MKGDKFFIHNPTVFLFDRTIKFDQPLSKREKFYSITVWVEFVKL